MLRFQRGLSVLIVMALLVAVFGAALPIQAAPSLRASSEKQSPVESAIASAGSSTPSRFSTPTHSAQSASLVMTSTLDAPTASGPSMYLNGTNYVSIPNASLPVIGSGDFTLEAWIYPTTVTGFHAVMAKWYSLGFWFGVYNGKLRFYRGSGSFVESTAAIPINRWTHIAVNSYYDAWDNVYIAEFYINGDLDGYQLHTGAAAVGGAYNLTIGSDQGTEYFVGDLAEARLWLGALGGETLRRNMHHALNEKRPGLVANWHLTGDFKDSISGLDGTPIGSPAFVGFPSPAQPDVSVTDRFFNTLPQATYAAAAAFVPRLNRAVVAGGIRAGTPSSVITSIDAASGVSSDLGNLPAARSYATAAYAASNDTVYVFGGSDQLVTTTAFDSIYAVNPETGAVRNVAATLPAGRDNATAVYLEHLNKIIIFGGWYYNPTEQYADSVYVFDVASESISPAAFTLPQAGYGLAAAYSPLTQKVYFFGGSSGAVLDDGAYELTLNADNSGSITKLAATLPAADRGGVAVEDSITHLIYILNGQYNGNAIAFDPTSNELWRTPIELPRDDGGNLLIRPYSSVIYAPRQRHALVIGGGYYNSSGSNTVWRVPLGDGPSVPIGHWDFVNSFIGNLDYMSSVYWRVAMGRKDSVVQYYDSDNAVRYPGALNAAGLGGMTVSPFDGNTWFTTWNGNTVNVKRDTGSAIETRFTETRAQPVPAYMTPDAISMFNSSTPFFGNGLNLKWQNVGDFIANTWHNSFVATGLVNNWEWTRLPAIAQRSYGETWAIVEPWYTAIGRPGNAPTTGGPVPTRPQLGRLLIDYFGTNFSQNLYGFPCGASLWAKDLVFGLNGDWWIGGDGGVCRYSSLYPPSSGFGGNLFAPTIGSNVVKLAVDGDGRVWAALMPDLNGNGGGLSAYEVLGPANTLGTVRTQDWNWLTAPIGSLTPTANGWNSGIRTLTANGERVWMALNTNPTNGPLAMYSPRWQQLTGLNEGSLWGAKRVFLARGRAFIASDSRLITLQPDGITWDDRAVAGVKAVTGDSKGRIWVGASDGVRRWTSAGWDMLSGALGTAPTGPINAIAEDAKGRLWIGGENGLTLFDRERWVTTLQPPTGSISVTAVLVDRDDRVWAGTAQGLARLNADQSWTTFTTADNLYTNHVFDLTQLGDGQIAVSTSGTGGGLSLFNGTTFVKQSYPPGKDQPLTTDQAGRLWAGAINREPTGYYGRFWTNSGLINSTVVDNAGDGANLVWFTHPGGGVSIRSAYLPALADVQPQINPANGVVPNRGSRGETVIINGSGFGTEKSAVEVIIGGAPVDISTVSDTQIAAVLSGDNLTGDVTVRRGKRSATLSGGATPAFCAVPRITNVTPTGGNVGVEVKITGSNFDVGATVQLGGGSVKTLGLKGAGTASAWIDSTDTNGNILINNRCANTTATFNDFRKFNVTLNRLTLNQGYVGLPFFAGNATLASAYFSLDQTPRPTDAIQADHIRLEMGSVGSAGRVAYGRWITATIPYVVGVPNPATFADIDNAVNLPNVIYSGTGPTEATLELVKAGRTVASASITVNYEAASAARVLLIPIMPDGYSPQLLNDMKATIDANLADYRYRIYPGGLTPIWSDEVVPRSRVTSAVSITIASSAEQNEAGKEFERIRQRYNSTHWDKIGVTFGVVHTSVYTGAPGMAQPGALPNWQSQADCEDSFISDVKSFFGFDKDCVPEFPQFLGWAIGDNLASRYFSHELGHMLGLVPSGAANYVNYAALTGGDGHSRYSELVTNTMPSGTRIAACSEANAVFSAADSFYRQPGVAEPVVNPITGVQLDNQLSDGNAGTARAKSLLSYACGRGGTNTYFDVADLTYLRANRYSSLRPVYEPNGLLAARSINAPTVDQRERIHVSGVITHDVGGETGAITGVEVKDNTVKTSADYLTGYQLVQYDASNVELSRWGVYPLMESLPNTHTGGEQGQFSAPQHPQHEENHSGFFSASLPKVPGVARIDLVTGTLTLATFSAGTTAPSVSISSPVGGEDYASGAVPIEWTATDGDADPLQISIEFSRDNGATWTPIASANDSGLQSITVPIEQLAGSANARVRVWASDGFLSGTVTGNAFSVAAQPPHPYIITPLASATYLEGQAVPLLGRAADAQDGVITSTLTWRSDRDGLLGTGEAQNVLLSAGTHVITLEAVNSAALSAITTVIITVQPDYDADGLSDEREAALGLNALTERDAWSDTDGDGLTYIVELKRNTDPNNPDSDGDGRSDGDEVADGSDPATLDSPRPNVLSVWPLSMTFEIDLSQPGQLPQTTLAAFSNLPVSATFSTSTPWIDLDSADGQTPALTTVVINPIGLAEGPQYGSITVNSDLGSMTVPITVTASNKADFCDANRDGATNQADIAAVQSRVGSIIGGANYAVQYDVNRDGAIDAADVALIGPCVITYGDVRVVYLPLVRR